MASTVIITDANGDDQLVPIADTPPENAVLTSIESFMSSVDSTLAEQSTNISALRSKLNDVKGDTSSIISSVDDVKSSVDRQSYYRDMVHLDKGDSSSESNQLSDTDPLSTTVDAIVAMQGGKIHCVTDKGGERTVPAIPGVPHKVRITKIYQTGTTASDIVGYVEK